eukprot:jgi/Tetstr1/461108/TSEL_006247.t1
MVRQNASLTAGRRRPQYIVQYIRQPQLIMGGGSVARGIAVQRQCARRHQGRARPRLLPCRLPGYTAAGGAAGRSAGGGLDSRCVAAGAAWAPRIGAAARLLQPARVRHHPEDVVAFAEIAAAWLAKARAVLAEQHRRRGARRAARTQGLGTRPPYSPISSRRRGGVGWGAVDHLSHVDMVHMEMAVPIDFQKAWAETQCCVNERVVAAVEADDPVVLDRALKWKYVLPQLLLRAPSRGRRRRQHALTWRFRAFAERRMTELMRSWDDTRTETFYAGHARQRRTEADLYAALLVGTADTVVALVEDGELSRVTGRLSSKDTGDLVDPAILAQLRDKHPSRSHPIPDAAYDIPVDEAAVMVDMRVPYQQLKQHVAAGLSGMRNEYLRCFMGEYAPASGHAAVRALSEVASMYLQGRRPGWFNRLFASARLVAPIKKLREGRAPDVWHVTVGEAERRAAERAMVDNMNVDTSAAATAVHQTM